MKTVKARMMSLHTPQPVAGAVTLKLGTRSVGSQEPRVLDGLLNLWVEERPGISSTFACGREFIVKIIPVECEETWPAAAEACVESLPVGEDDVDAFKPALIE